MIPYLLRRLVEALPTLFLVSVVVFFLTRILPGDPVRLLLGEEPDPKVAEEVRRSLGLDRPLLVQYASWLWNLFQGDLGRSIKDGTPVARLILEKLPTTLELATLAMLVALAIGLPSGVVAAVRRGTWLDGLVTSTSLMGVSVPNFFLGIMLIYLFSLRLGWVPPSGYVELWIDPKRNLLLMVLPAVTLGTALAGAIARFTRNSLLEAQNLHLPHTPHKPSLPPPGGPRPRAWSSRRMTCTTSSGKRTRAAPSLASRQLPFPSTPTQWASR